MTPGRGRRKSARGDAYRAVSSGAGSNPSQPDTDRRSLGGPSRSIALDRCASSSASSPRSTVAIGRTRLRQVRSLQASAVSIGGAGTFDGVFLSGVLAVLLGALV